MSHFTSTFWDFYIGVISVVSILACGVFLMAQSKRRVAGGQAETTGHTWDEDLGEYNNPLPRWWMWLFWITIVFGLVYLALYPGLGSYAGLWKWTQVSQLEQETKHAEAHYGPIYEKFAGQDVAQLAKNLAGARHRPALPQHLCAVPCLRCRGQAWFPNLTDNDWLYGGDPATIKATITNGRNGIMPPFAPALGEQGTKDVAHYVMSLSGMAADSIRVERGKPLFAQTCAACHGADGKGNQQLGAPNLTDKTWLYGAGEAAIIEGVTRGRNNQMPAHKDLLTPAKIHLLTAYVYSLSQQK
jgi:cytochrome c oxidase cbb3-type subunit 3